MSVPNPLLAGAAALLLTLALAAAVRSRFVRGRLLFSTWLLVAYLALQLAVTQAIGDPELVSALARLAFVLALVNLSIALLVNPWRENRPSDRFPAIVQDVTVIALFLLIATVLMREQLLATSAVGAVVVGFALQDTLGNLFAGLAIQVEKPFRVGHWIGTGGNEGQVQQVTWRATKLRTKSGQFLIVPNSVISKEPILNYSEPIVPTRIDVEVGASYLSPPDEVKDAIRRALRNAPLVMSDPQPVIVVLGFGASSIDYVAKFWIEDYGTDVLARDQVRTNIWYEFRRSGIEIPWPIQVEYHRKDQPLRTEHDVEAAAERLGTVDLFATLEAGVRTRLAASAADHLFRAGEAIVRQGEHGSSMFVVLEGTVVVVLEPSGQQVADIGAGGFFGEMSVLTGAPRTATVRAATGVRVLEIAADQMSQLARSTPGLPEHMARLVADRRVGLAAAEANAAAGAAGATAARQSILARIQAYLHLD